MKIEHWKGRPHFALYDDNDELIAVFVYRKGAEAVKARLEQHEHREEDTNAAIAHYPTKDYQTQMRV